MLWLLLSAMALAATAAAVWPLLARQARPRPRADHDVEVYRDQLAELARDRDRGLVAPEEAAAAKAEIGRRLLAAAEAAERGEAAAPSRRAPALLAAALAAALPVLAAALYGVLGSPGLPGAAPGLVDRLAARMAANPGDPEGWRLLGRSLARLDRHDEAAEAYRQAAALRPDDAALRALRGQALTAAAGGRVGAPAREAFAAALARNPGEPLARFYLGLAALQSGNRAEALARWRALAAALAPDSPWAPMLRAGIAGLTGSADGPIDAEAAARAAEMSPEDRAATIHSMVEGLAARLAEAPDDAEGWARLARAYRVLGEAEKARDALAALARLRPEDAGALAAYAWSLLETEGPSAALDGIVVRILARDPGNRAALWIAGAAAAERGDAAEARRFWERLRALLPEGSAERGAVDRQLAALAGGAR